MIEKGLRLFVGFCVATVLTQLIVTTVYAVRGTLTMDSATQMIGLLNGIALSAQRIRAAIDSAESTEQPSYEEVLEQRAAKGLDMDLRLASQAKYREELEVMLADLREERGRFDRRREDFQAELKRIKEGAEKDGMRELQKTLQAMDSEQAKEQLVRMHDDGRIDDIVNIIQATALDKRTDILAEFVSEKEAELLEEILRRIGQGEPMATVIDRAGP
jgi:flagellar motility protein MotE (MotC chaperone)